MAVVTGYLSRNALYLAQNWQGSGVAGADSGRKGVEYLRVIRDLAMNPAWIGISEQAADCSAALDWIGTHIGPVNRELHGILQECLSCFHASQRPAVQIFAAPILTKAGVDGFCNLEVQPVTLVVDPGRVIYSDWYKLVMHELAHGIARTAGHGEKFRLALAHLCLAFDLPPPPAVDAGQRLQSWPPYGSHENQSGFWQSS